jgi:hypothetical protein
MKTAIVQMADQGPLESTVVMLRSVGYECYLPSDNLLRELREIGCDTVIDIEGLIKNWGYERSMDLPKAPPVMMNKTDLYVDVKAHRSYDKIVGRWPHLKNRILWGRINGGKPEHVIKADGMDCGDEVNPPCPVLTPNLWYKLKIESSTICHRCNGNKTYILPGGVDVAWCPVCEGVGILHKLYPWAGRAYACWPVFYRFDNYFSVHGRQQESPPVCLTHNLYGWGYGDLIERCRNLGVKCYGKDSPDGLIQHIAIPKMLSQTLCLVHLKSSDAPGYSLYEALAAACPIVCSRRLIWRNRMQELFIPGETCLVFDRETHDPLSPDEVDACEGEIIAALDRLEDPKENSRIGMAGREKLMSLMWDPLCSDDVNSLRTFMERSFP